MYLTGHSYKAVPSTLMRLYFSGRPHDWHVKFPSSSPCIWYSWNRTLPETLESYCQSGLEVSIDSEDSILLLLLLQLLHSVWEERNVVYWCDHSRRQLNWGEIIGKDNKIRRQWHWNAMSWGKKTTISALRITPKSLKKYLGNKGIDKVTVVHLQQATLLGTLSMI